MDVIDRHIKPEIVELFQVKYEKIGINEVFIVKYDSDGQTRLDYHRDGSEFSFVIQLNDNFTGGGTTFQHNERSSNNIKGGIGDCILFSGQNRHKGYEITSGTRYILTGFLNYDNNACELLSELSN